jgi:hypothetical protein
MFDFNPEQILRENNVLVEWDDNLTPGWSLSWKHGVIYIGPCCAHMARKAAAMFVYLYLKDVPAQMAANLIVCYAFIDMYRDIAVAAKTKDPIDSYDENN